MTPIKVCHFCLKVDITPETHECNPNRMMDEENGWK